jgi:hypothetical protein
MIDEPRKTELLVAGLKESLPIQANVTPHLARELAKQTPIYPFPADAMLSTFFIVVNMAVLFAA